jgi:hypothetical protein
MDAASLDELLAAPSSAVYVLRVRVNLPECASFPISAGLM